MTSKAPVWEPSETIFAEQEEAMTNFRGDFISSETITRGRLIINYFTNLEDDAVDLTDKKIFYNALKSKVNVSRVGASKVKHGVTLEYLSHEWFI